MAIELRGSGTIEDEAPASSKPSRVEKITAALTAIEADGSVAGCITETPGAFLWEFYKAWVENGGQDGGKNRNSIRRMREVWLIGEHEVKSLHPKLTGKVRISKDDARSLIALFLGRWKFSGIREGDWVLTPDGYAPFPCRDCKALCERLVDAMYPSRSGHAEIGILLPAQSTENRPVPGRTNWSNLLEQYRHLDALIYLSRHNSTIGPTPSDTIRLFWEYMNELYDNLGDKEILFIWIVDIGARQAEEERSWKDFLNFEMMKTQFRAFASFDSEGDLEETTRAGDTDRPNERSGIHDAFLRSLTIPEEGHREKRWKWLCQRSVVVIQNLRKEEFQHLYIEEDRDVEKLRLRDIGITAENILPSMMPNRWAQSRELQQLYGGDLTDISDATLTIHYNIKPKHGETTDSSNIRYFAYGLTPQLTNGASLNSVGRSIELDSPGQLYDEAMSLVYWAARHRLLKGKGSDKDRKYENDWSIALAYLRNQGFRVIRLPEFMQIHRSPGD